MKQLVSDPTGKTIKYLRFTTERVAFHFTDDTVFLINANTHHPYEDEIIEAYLEILIPQTFNFTECEDLAYEAYDLEIITEDEFYTLKKKFEIEEKESKEQAIKRLKEEIEKRQQEITILIKETI